MFKEEIMYNWIKYLKLLIRNHFAYAGTMYDDENLLQQQIPEQLWENIRVFVANLRELPVWKDRSKAATVFGSKNPMTYWEEIFKTGKSPDGTQVLVSPLNVTEMIQR